MKGNKATVITLADRCKNILAANWQGHLNAIKADAKGSKEDIYTSKAKYILKRERPYIWVPEKDMHNVLPTWVALTGDVVPLKSEKAQSAAESLKEVMLSEQRAIGESSDKVSGLLSSSNFITTSGNVNLKELLNEHETYMVYKFNVSSYMYMDSHGCAHVVDSERF